jgi:hypothetical protein
MTKSETRNPKSETNPNPNHPNSKVNIVLFRILNLGFVSDFVFRISDFE